MDHLTNGDLAKQNNKTNKKEILFIENYIKTGNATQAYISAFNLPRSKYHSATVRASKLKQKYPNLDKLFYEYSAGLNAKKIADVIKEAMSAKKQVIYKGIHEFPDHNTRLRAIEVFDKLVNKDDKSNNIAVMTGLQITIQK